MPTEGENRLCFLSDILFLQSASWGKSGGLSETADKPRNIEKYSIFVFREGDRLALVKRPKKGVLAGLYAFYQVAGHVSKKEALEEARKLGFSALKLRELGATRHIFTHKEWDMIGYEIDLGEFPEAVVKEEGFRFYTREEIKNNLSIPSAYGVYKSFVLS